MRRDEAAEKEEQRILEQSEIEMHQETGTETSNACVVHLSSLSPIPVSEVVLGLFRLPNCWEGSEKPQRRGFICNVPIKVLAKGHGILHFLWPRMFEGFRGEERPATQTANTKPRR
ncbi:hypothetical protein I308_100783 [Cryptococcus tetragattii IND107]|uniref:Uncharacterized protein n=1 Tax=Cryptococcus tetragattii IND107 TaxID=1296105 RepID=A0ABR3C5S2_9TREE